MNFTRRETIGGAVGALFAGCNSSSEGGTDTAESGVDKGEANLQRENATPTGDAETETQTPTAPFEDTARVFVSETGDEVVAARGTEVVASRPSDVGAVINDAQDAVSGAEIYLETGGPVATSIALDESVEIRGSGDRTTVYPGDEVDDSFEVVHLSDGSTGARCSSLHVDMEHRGTSAVRADGGSDLSVRGLNVANAGEFGVRFDRTEDSEVTGGEFERAGTAAIGMIDSSNVAVRDCELAQSGPYGVYAEGCSNVTVRGVDAAETKFNSFAMYEYTTDWTVVDCTAADDGHTPFAASCALDGSFVECEAEGITAEGEGGFEIEYKAGHDSENSHEPVRGCSVVSCTARECNVGFYAREDDEKYDTDTPVVRPEFVDCTAVDCEIGLFIDDNVVEAIVLGFEAVDCATDVVDDGVRTVVDGWSENAGDPAEEGQWNGHADAAAELGVTVEDTSSGTLYEAPDGDSWEPI